ncbi:MAG: glycerol kinase, partial [Patescibacteria group bacterium]|nr:glycerol kinase [Patescibacteria group bacterium]
LLEIFGVPLSILPAVAGSASLFGTLRRDIVGGNIPIGAVVGDQEASAVAAGLEKGVTKVTYGTGAFVAQGLGENFALYNDFYTTLVPGLYGAEYMIEAKVAGYGEKVDKYLKDPVKLKEILTALADDVAKILAKLPLPINQLIVDGGITQDEFLVAEQERATGLKLVKQKIYDGTSLGVLYLLQDFLKQPRV